MVEALLDASVLIDFSLGLSAAERFVESMSSAHVFTHPAAEAELIIGAQDRAEMRALDELVRRFRRVRITPEDFDHCLAFVRRYSLSNGVGWPDCLIAATSLRLGLPVATLNDRHFRVFRGLKVVRPY